MAGFSTKKALKYTTKAVVMDDTEYTRHRRTYELSGDPKAVARMLATVQITDKTNRPDNTREVTVDASDAS